VFETSLVYIALVSVTTDNTVLGNAINYLTATQLQNGSWHDDAYGTALALRALFFSENKPPPPPVPTTGTITGTVVDAATNQPLSGATITAVNSQISATTTNTGAFTLSNIPAGSQPISVTLTGYATVAATVDVIVGSIINLGIIPLSQNPTTGIIKGIVTDTANGQPLSEVTITVTGSFTGSTVTASDGSFVFANVPPGSVEITASKTGLPSVIATATVAAGEILFFNLQLGVQPPTTTLIGNVTDAQTGNPIPGADVAIVGTTLSAITDNIGKYTISGITASVFDLKASAIGSNSLTYNIKTTSFGTYTIDFALAPSPVSNIRIASISTDKQSYGAYENVSIAATIENIGNVEKQVLVMAEIGDSQGNVVALVSPSNPDIVVPASGSHGIEGLLFQTLNNPPGIYTLIVQVNDPASGALLDKRSVSFSILPTVAIADAALGIIPRFTHVGATKAITVALSLTNRSNAPLDLTIEHEIKKPSGTVLISGVTPLVLLPEITLPSISLAAFSHTFTESGTYPIQAKVFKGTELLATVNDTISVAPAIRIDPSKTLTPQTIPPDEDKRIRIDIQLKGTVR